MRGKASPATPAFESPYATTILPAKDPGRAPKRAAAPAEPTADVAPPAPLAEAPVYIPTHGPTQAPAPAPIAAPDPVDAPPPAPLFAAPVTDYPVHYPSAPGFPPQPQYADSAPVADPAVSAPVGYPSASYQPGYQPGYQPAAYQPAAYQSATFAPPTTPPSGYQPNRFEPQGFEPQGFAAPGYAAPGYAAPGYAPPGQPFQNYPPPSGRSAGAKVLIGLAIGVVGFIGICILAAIAIPVFLSQQQKTANRNVVLPGILLEQQQVHSATLDTAAADAAAKLQSSITGITETQAAYYGPDGQPLFAVIAGRLPNKPTAADENSFFTGVATDDRLTGFAPTESGPYGGKMECGQAVAAGEAPITFCASVDSAAVVVIVGLNQTTNQTAILARQIIGSIEPARH